MDETVVAKLFRNGGSQAVRLPAQFRFEGEEVRVRRHGRGVLIEPLVADAEVLFAVFDRYSTDDFLSDREQPPMPDDSATL